MKPCEFRLEERNFTLRVTELPPRAERANGAWMKAVSFVILFGLAGAACAANNAGSPSNAKAPVMLLGEFVDDYGGRFTITAIEWLQHPTNRYRVVRWNAAEQYLVAQNDATNSSAPNLWTRIDWIRLSNMAPYEWAFCLSAYEAPAAAAAEATRIADREAPKTGCNGFPFSRMRRTGRAKP